jgi:hypothetical protein
VSGEWSYETTPLSVHIDATYVFLRILALD